MRKFLFVLIIFMCLPLMVLADSAGPSILGYDAVVINKNGAKYQDSDGNTKVIKYNTKVYVYGEGSDDVYACPYSGKSECGDGEAFSLSIKDIAPLKKEVVPNDLKKIKKQETFLEEVNVQLLVTEKNGIKLKKGPAEVYEKYNKVIPRKKVLNAKYAISHYTPESTRQDGLSYSWYYIDDGEYKGWIDVGFATYTKDSFITFDDVKMYDMETDELIATIPSETIINGYYYFYNVKLYFTYKDKFGYINGTYKVGDDEFQVYGGTSKEGYVVTLDSIEMKSKGKAISGIPKAQMIKVIYGFDDYSEHGAHSVQPICIKKNECYYYVEYNGTKGFISDKNLISFFASGEIDEDDKLEEDKELYDFDYNKYDEVSKNVKFEEYSKLHKTNIVIPAGIKLETYYGWDITDPVSNKKYDLSLVKYNNTLGWIISYIDDNNNDNPATSEPVPIVDNNDETGKIIVYCIIGAIAFGLISIIVLVIVNKKKKKEEVKPVEAKSVDTKEVAATPLKKEELENNKNAEK